MRFALFSASAAFLAAAEDPVRTAFEQFRQKWQRHYLSEEEEALRFQAFSQNFQMVAEENSKGNTYELELNKFADLTPEEFSSYLGNKNKPDTRWGAAEHLGTHDYTGQALPDSWDWVAKGAVTPVKDQGTCGSCWAFSSTGALEGALFVASGSLTSLSEQQFVDCTKAYGELACSGGDQDPAFEYAQANAICTEDSYPYKGKKQTCKPDSCTVGLPKGSVTGYKDVQADDVNALMDAVAQQPVAISIDANTTGFKLYKTGVIQAQCGAKLDHAVLLVGYGTLNGVPYWKVKNSWGPDWGMDGYVLIERGVKTPQGMCGIRAEPSYPVIHPAPSPAPRPSPAPGPSPGATCCNSSDSDCKAGQTCCASGGKAYASESSCRRYGAKHGCVWSGSTCAVPSALFVV